MGEQETVLMPETRPLSDTRPVLEAALGGDGRALGTLHGAPIALLEEADAFLSNAVLTADAVVRVLGDYIAGVIPISAVRAWANFFRWGPTVINDRIMIRDDVSIPNQSPPSQPQFWPIRVRYELEKEGAIAEAIGVLSEATDEPVPPLINDVFTKTVAEEMILNLRNEE